MRLSDRARKELAAAHKAWRDAERAYHEESNRYAANAFADEEYEPSEVFDGAAETRLDGLLDHSRAMRDAYAQVLRRHFD